MTTRPRMVRADTAARVRGGGGYSQIQPPSLRPAGFPSSSSGSTPQPGYGAPGRSHSFSGGGGGSARGPMSPGADDLFSGVFGSGTGGGDGPRSSVSGGGLGGAGSGAGSGGGNGGGVSTISSFVSPHVCIYTPSSPHIPLSFHFRNPSPSHSISHYCVSVSIHVRRTRGLRSPVLRP